MFIPVEDFDNCFSEITGVCLKDRHVFTGFVLCVCVQITTLIITYIYTLILAPIHVRTNMHYYVDIKAIIYRYVRMCNFRHTLI